MKNKRFLTVLALLLAVTVACVLLAACNEAKTFTVTFGGEGVETFTKQVKEGKAVDEPTPPVRDGYVFGGWMNNGKPWDFDKAITADITLTAAWSAAEYKITLDANGGGLSEGAQTEYTVKTDETFSLPVPTYLSDLEFRGWALNGTLMTGADGKSTTPWGTRGDATLKAVWTNKGTKDLFEVTTKQDGSFAISAWGDSFSEEITFPNAIAGKTVSELGSMSKLTSKRITVPASVTRIGTGAFLRNYYVEIADLSAFEGTIGENAFYASNVSIVELGSTKTIEAGAFGNSLIKLLYIPQSVTSIGNEALAGDSFGEIDFEKDFPALGSNVFGLGNDDLALIASQSAWDKLVENASGETFAQKVQNVTGLVHGDLYTWTEEMVAEGNALHGMYSGEGLTTYLGLGLNIAVHTNQTTLADIYDGKTSSDHFYDFAGEPRKTYYLNSQAKTLEVLAANDNGEVIKDGMLYDYFGTDIVYTVPEGVTAIAGGAGMSNTAVRFFLSGDNVTSIGDFVFAYGNLFGVTIGKNVAEIGEFAFFYNSYMMQLIFEGTTAPTIGQGAFCDLLSGISIVPLTLNSMAYRGITVRIYTVDTVATWLGHGAGYPFYQALVDSLDGLDLGTLESPDGTESPVTYETNSFATLRTSYFAAKGNTYESDYGTITMSGADNGYAYITLKDNKGTSYIYFSPVETNGYSFSYSDDTSAPLKIEMFTFEDINNPSTIVYGYFGNGKLNLRGDEAGIYGDIDSDYFVIDGYGNITYRKQDGTLLSGTYTLSGSSLTVTGIEGVTSLTIDTQNHTVTSDGKQLTALGEEAGIYYDLVNRAILKLDGKATDSSSGTMELTFQGTTVTIPYNINGTHLKFKLDDEDNDWTFNKNSDTICDGYYDDYTYHLKFCVISEAAHSSYTKGSDTLELDGFFTATLNGKEYYYYQFGTSILLFDGDDVTIYNLDSQGGTFEQAGAAEAGIYYTTTSKNYRVYLDGRGNLAYFSGDEYDIGTYTLNADKKFDVVLEGLAADQSGILDSEKGYGIMAYYVGSSCSFMGLSKQPFESLSSSVRLYFTKDNKVTTTCPYFSIYLTANALIISEYGKMPWAFELNGEQQQSFSFDYTTDDGTAKIIVKFEQGESSKVTLTAERIVPEEALSATVDGTQKNIVICWLDEGKTKVGIYEDDGWFSDIIYGTVEGSASSGSFTITNGDKTYRVTGYGSGELTLTEVKSETGE